MNQTNQAEWKDYVDTRGPWPVYVNGVTAVELRGKPLDISVEDARVVVYGR
jgi:hypothetical protein